MARASSGPTEKPSASVAAGRTRRDHGACRVAPTPGVNRESPRAPRRRGRPRATRRESPRTCSASPRRAPPRGIRSPRTCRSRGGRPRRRRRRCRWSAGGGRPGRARRRRRRPLRGRRRATPPRRSRCTWVRPRRRRRETWRRARGRRRTGMCRRRGWGAGVGAVTATETMTRSARRTRLMMAHPPMQRAARDPSARDRPSHSRTRRGRPSARGRRDARSAPPGGGRVRDGGR